MLVRKNISIGLDVDKLSSDYLCSIADKLYEGRAEIPFTERQLEIFVSGHYIDILNNFLIEEVVKIGASIPKGTDITINNAYINRCGNIQVNQRLEEKESFIQMVAKENYVDVNYDYPLIDSL